MQICLSFHHPRHNHACLRKICDELCPALTWSSTMIYSAGKPTQMVTWCSRDYLAGSPKKMWELARLAELHLGECCIWHAGTVVNCLIHKPATKLTLKFLLNWSKLPPALQHHATFPSVMGQSLMPHFELCLKILPWSLQLQHSPRSQDCQLRPEQGWKIPGWPWPSASA